MYFTASLFSKGCPRLLGKEEIYSKNYILKCTNSSSEKQRLSKSCTIKVMVLKIPQNNFLKTFILHNFSWYDRYT